MVGCAGSYDRRAQRGAGRRQVAKARRRELCRSGREEKCTGESARRLGDEFLFQELAQANIATLSQYKVRKIVAHCPHCVNSFLRDYPQFGGHYEVVHHTQLIAQLIRDGRLNLGRGAGAASSSGIAAANPGGAESGAAAESVVTYHDPCYLARVNGIHEAPRTVLKAALGLASGPVVFREMPRHREKTFCCGAGGGRIWMEEDPRKRVSTARAQEALDTGAKTVAVGCPFCLTMMTDGVAANDEAARVLDVAELLAENGFVAKCRKRKSHAEISAKPAWRSQPRYQRNFPRNSGRTTDASGTCLKKQSLCQNSNHRLPISSAEIFCSRTPAPRKCSHPRICHPTSA